MCYDIVFELFYFSDNCCLKRLKLNSNGLGLRKESNCIARAMEFNKSITDLGESSKKETINLFYYHGFRFIL